MRFSALALALFAVAEAAWAAPADDQYVVASEHYRRGRWELAADELRTFLADHADHPRHATARFLLGETLVQLGRYEAARQAFAAFLERTPQHQFARQARFRQGEIAYLDGQYEAARSQLEAFRETYPDDPLNAYALAYLGDILLREERPAEAEKVYAEALRRFPESELADECRFGLGRCYRQQGDAESAERFFRFLTISDSGPLADDALLQLGTLRYEQARHAEALETFRKLARIAPQGPLALRGRYWQARCHLALEQPEAARDLLKAAVVDEAEPELAAAITFEYGQVLRRLGDLDAARRQYEDVGRKWPESTWNAEALEARVTIAFATGNHIAVGMLADQFLRKYPEHPLRPRVRLLAGRSLLQDGHADEAARALRQVLDDLERDALPSRPDPSTLEEPLVEVGEPSVELSDRSALRATAGYFLALAELAADRPEDCLRVLDPLLAETLAADLRRGLLATRASALMSLERYELAVAALRDYLDAAPQGAEADKCRAQLCVALARLERLEDADPVYERLAETCGDRSLLLQTTLYLAEENRRAGRTEPARRLYLVLADKRNPAEIAGPALVALARLEMARSDAAGSQTARSDAGGSVTGRSDAGGSVTGRSDGDSEASIEREQTPAETGLAEAGRAETADAAPGATGAGPAGANLAGPSGDGSEPLAASDQASPLDESQRASEAPAQDEPSRPLGGEVPTFDQLLDQFADRPEAARAALLRAADLERKQQVEAAVEAYRQVYERFADSREAPRARLAAAQLRQTQKQWEAAEAILRETADRYPDFEQNDAVHYLWAWTLADLGRHAEADRVFEELAERFPESTYWADATYRLAERAARRGDLPRAGQLADQLLESDIAADVRSHALYLRGQVAAGAGQWEMVERTMGRLMEETPDSPLALPAEYWLAEAAYRMARHEVAEERFRALAHRTDGRSESWLAMITLRRAQLLAGKRQWDEARELAESIGERFPGFRQQYEADYLLGRCFGSRGQFRDAREAYERVVRSPEGGRTEIAAMAQWMIGETYFHQKSYAEAIKAYHRVETLYAYPRWQAAALLQAGKCHEMLGNWNESVKLYAQLLKNYPGTRFHEEASQRLRQAKLRDRQPDRQTASESGVSQSRPAESGPTG